MNKIKLVIWDLDETFWRGTLSEEGIVKIDENIKLVKDLSKRGIINSIASKNDFQIAKNKLVELEVWQYFVFPKISWLPKGQLVKEIIESCNLRPDNVLFIDDNHLNLEEVKFYNKNIYCKLPKFIQQINTNSALLGKNDEELSRLNQYKILEKKEIKKKNYSDNIEFLRDSNITISISDPIANDFERIYELIQRTNQLNFTKLRSTRTELQSILNSKSFNNKVIRVKDKFGDYGLVGFVSIKKSEYKHFVFSCRVLNLGIEQFVNIFFNKPKLNIKPKVSSDLSLYKVVDWIKLEKKIKKKIIKSPKIEILIKGGCDLLQSGHYLEKYFNISYELNKVLDSIPIRVEHTALLSLSDSDSMKLELLNIPFIKNFSDTNFFNNKNLVYSLLMDYDQYLYEYDSIIFPLSFKLNKNNSELENHFIERNIKISMKDINDLSKKINFLGKMTPEILENNLFKINKKLNIGVKLTLIGASSKYIGTSEHESTLINSLNEAVRSFCLKHNHNFIDLDKVFNDGSYFRDSYKHYSRKGYEKIAREINNIYRKNEISKDYFTDIYLELRHFYRKIRLKFK